MSILLNTICMNSTTLKDLIRMLESYQMSILDFKLYIDESNVPIELHTEADYEPYLSYYPFYIIEDATFDNIRYTKRIRIYSPKGT